jgi:hypothetical protein
MSEHRSERQGGCRVPAEAQLYPCAFVGCRSGANAAMNARAQSRFTVHDAVIERVLLGHRTADVRYDRL